LGFGHVRDHLWIYLVAIAIVLPMVFGVSYLDSFQRKYPMYDFAGRSWSDFFLWTAMYSAQFLALEFFFRGHWLRAFSPVMGGHAITAMIIPYAMIHMNKPFGEAIGSIAAGLALGALAIRSRCVYPGFLVHASIGFAMDLAALWQKGAVAGRLNRDDAPAESTPRVRCKLRAMTDDADDLQGRIDALRRAGRYAEAANLCLRAGDPARASELFASVWDWPAAIRAAEQAGLFALAFRHALESNDRATLQRLLAILPDHPSQAVEAAGLAERKGRVVDAARLHEAAGDVGSAAELYERAGELGEAARCHESSGDYRKAGMLYERRIKEDPTDGEAALRLGRILAHFGRFEHAARALQIAEKDPERRRAARGLLVACFAALKLHDAAGACLDRIREAEPTLPIRVADFLRETFGDERGLAAYALGGANHDASQLLAGRYRVL
ncbi:MAG: tetratricopeptide repeat protein, partial [Myxococcales bacterium]|nr:tetratricopeptide repeat protein [Myxococcales bacterium]